MSPTEDVSMIMFLLNNKTITYYVFIAARTCVHLEIRILEIRNDAQSRLGDRGTCPVM